MELFSSSPQAATAFDPAVMSIARGRFREGEHFLRDALSSTALHEPFPDLSQLLLHAGTGSREVFREEARRICATRSSARAALMAAMRGELDIARECLSEQAPRESALREIAVAAIGIYSSLAAGNTRAAVASVKSLQRPTWVHRSLLGLVQGDACFAARDHKCVLEGYFEYRTLGNPEASERSWRSWAYPRVLYREAVAHEALGHLPEARERVDRLLRLWKDADPCRGAHAS